jgi:triosephosphate isomerase
VNRRPVIAGNIKMHLTVAATLELLRGIRSGLDGSEAAEVVVFPPFTALADAGRFVSSGPIGLGGQNLFWEAEGAWTGEISPRMLADTGCRWVLIGHSERRQHFGETDESVRRKVAAALAHDLRPIVCVGELLNERESGRTESVLARQVEGGLSGFAPAELTRVTLAYEPVWAIGTGKTATPDLAEQAHEYLRSRLELLAPGFGDSTRILYGGSVKADNAAGLLERPGIDGALVGGASLSPASFLAIIRAAGRQPAG